MRVHLESESMFILGRNTHLGGTSSIINDCATGTSSSCGVIDNGDGTKTLSCPDGTSVVVSDGAAGQDESSFSVEYITTNLKLMKISCDDGTSVLVADGLNGTDNKAIASIYCSGIFEDWTNLTWNYNVIQLSSGDVISTGTIGGELFETSRTNYFSQSQNGYVDASVTVRMDVLGAGNYGWWLFTLNRTTLIINIEYHDLIDLVDLVDLVESPKT